MQGLCTIKRPPSILLLHVPMCGCNVDAAIAPPPPELRLIVAIAAPSPLPLLDTTSLYFRLENCLFEDLVLPPIVLYFVLAELSGVFWKSFKLWCRFDLVERSDDLDCRAEDASLL
jgi:hypothetical protein